MRKMDQPIAIVDDDKSVLDALKGSLAGISDDVIAFGSPVKCIDSVALGKYDLLITDINMPEMSGLDLVKKVKEIDPGLAVLVITGFADISLAVKSIQFGAVDFIEKPFSNMKITGAVKQVIADQQEIGRDCLRKLTKTEIVILYHIVDGLSNSEVARKLSRSIRTVEDHRANVMRKLEVDNIVDLLKKATDIGIVSSK